MNKSKIVYALLTIFLALSAWVPVQAFQAANIKANVPPHNSGYMFFILQYQFFESDIFNKGSSLYFDFDTEAAFAQASFKVGLVEIGPRVKFHLADWQNLEFITDTSTGKRVESREIKATHLMGGAFVKYNAGRYYGEAFGHYMHTLLKHRSNASIETANGSWFAGGVRLGWWQKYPAKADIEIGSSLNFTVTSYTALQKYHYSLSGVNLSEPQGQFFDFEINYYRGGYLGPLIYKAYVNAGVLDFAKANDSMDMFFAYSLGGPEARYRRLAGFAFSEFRSPAYALVNLDMYIPVAGPVYLWTIADFLIHDREYNGDYTGENGGTGNSNASQRVHSGVGLGVYVELAKQTTFVKSSAIFARFDYALTARRAEHYERIQLFFGLSAFW